MYDHYNFEDATAYQVELAKQLNFQAVNKIETIAGADISFDKNSTTMYAGIVILTYPGMVLKSFALETYETNFPYKPGFLAFKEVPALLKVRELILNKPDVVVLDGNGILHPRRMGVASHFGILANQATIGCAKSLLHGQNHQPQNVRFSTTEIKNNAGEMLGFALKTKRNCAPVYVSAGHLITQEESLNTIKKSVGNYRIPEPTRMAHNIVNDFRLGKLKAGFHEVVPSLTLF